MCDLNTDFWKSKSKHLSCEELMVMNMDLKSVIIGSDSALIVSSTFNNDVQ